jgi:hypothetical protein
MRGGGRVGGWVGGWVTDRERELGHVVQPEVAHPPAVPALPLPIRPPWRLLLNIVPEILIPPRHRSAPLPLSERMRERGQVKGACLMLNTPLTGLTLSSPS